jgi:hypothetical protein
VTPLGGPVWALAAGPPIMRLPDTIGGVIRAQMPLAALASSLDRTAALHRALARPPAARWGVTGGGDPE